MHNFAVPTLGRTIGCRIDLLSFVCIALALSQISAARSEPDKTMSTDLRFDRLLDLGDDGQDVVVGRDVVLQPLQRASRAGTASSTGARLEGCLRNLRRRQPCEGIAGWQRGDLNGLQRVRCEQNTSEGIPLPGQSQRRRLRNEAPAKSRSATYQRVAGAQEGPRTSAASALSASGAQASSRPATVSMMVATVGSSCFCLWL
jgi:hypothetical protein